MHSDKNARDESRLRGLASSEFRSCIFDHISRSGQCYVISAPREGTSSGVWWTSCLMSAFKYIKLSEHAFLPARHVFNGIHYCFGILSITQRSSFK